MGSDKSLLSLQHSYRQQPIMGNHQLVIISQLLQNIAHLHTLDDVFQWFAYTVMRRLDIKVVQVWALQNYITREMRTELRAMVCQNPALSKQNMFTSHMSDLCTRMLQVRCSIPSQHITTVFSPSMVDLLQQHKVNYWTGYFLTNSSLLLPVTPDHPFNKKIPTPLTLFVSLFLEQAPGRRLLATVGQSLEQVMYIAKNRRMLLTASQPLTTIPLHGTSPLPVAVQPGPAGKRPSVPYVLNLIPHRLYAGNPSSGTILLSDQYSHRLYLAIDNHKNLTDLCAQTKMSTKEFYTSLRTLLSQKDILLYEEDGRPVDSNLILQSF